MNIWLQVLKYWREVFIVVLVAALSLGYYGWKHTKNALAQSETNVADAKVRMETFVTGVVQAQNELTKTQKELKESLSKQFQEELAKQNIKVLAAMKAQIEVTIDEALNQPGPPSEANVYHFSDAVMSNIRVDTNDPNAPLWSYKIAPLDFTLEATLGFDDKNGQAKFWAYPTLKNPIKGVHATIPRLEFSNGDEYNAWITKIRGKETQVAVPAKYTVGFMVGQEWAKEFAGGTRTVYGVDAVRNWSNGFGAGGGFLGSTIFVKGTFSFGK